MVSVMEINDDHVISDKVTISVSTNAVICSNEVQKVNSKGSNNVCGNDETMADNLDATTNDGEISLNNKDEKVDCRPVSPPKRRRHQSLLPIGLNEERIINSVPTSFICYGGSLDDIQDMDCIIFLIPGNPGIIEYYRSFLQNLHYGIGIVQPTYKTITIGLSHAGHQIIGNQDLYSLNGQVEHKLAFFREYLKNKKVILFSHSIGCYISLEIFKRDPEIAENIVHSFLLFPCIQQIRFTGNGKFFWACKPYYNWLIKPMLYPLFYIPQFVQRGLLKFYFYFRASLQLFNKEVAFRSLEMARNELEDVIELDEETVNGHVEKLFVYFGVADEWCPMSLCNETVEKIKDLDYCVCTNGIGHAFVLESSELMASLMLPKVAETMKKIELKSEKSGEESNEEFEDAED